MPVPEEYRTVDVAAKEALRREILRVAEWLEFAVDMLVERLLEKDLNRPSYKLLRRAIGKADERGYNIDQPQVGYVLASVMQPRHHTQIAVFCDVLSWTFFHWEIDAKHGTTTASHFDPIQVVFEALGIWDSQNEVNNKLQADYPPNPNLELWFFPLQMLTNERLRQRVLERGDSCVFLSKFLFSHDVLGYCPAITTREKVLAPEGSKFNTAAKTVDEFDPILSGTFSSAFFELLTDLQRLSRPETEAVTQRADQSQPEILRFTARSVAATPLPAAIAAPEPTKNYRLRRLHWDGFLEQILLLLGIDQAVAKHRVENVVSLLDGALSIDHQRRSSELLATDAQQLEDIGKHLVGTDRIYHKVWYEIGQTALAWRKDADAFDYRQVNEKVTRWCGQLGLTYVQDSFFRLFCEEASSLRRF